MKTKRYIIIIGIYVLISLLLVTAGLFVTDSLPQKLAYKINSFISGFEIPDNKENVVPGISENIVPTADEAKKTLPEDMSAIWLDLDNDVTADPSNGALAFISEADGYFNYFGNFFTDTIFIKPDTEKKFSDITDDTGAHTDLLRAYLTRADEKEYVKGLIIDDSVIYDSKGKLTFDSVKYYLSNYTFDAVVLYSEKAKEEQKLYDTAVFFFENIKKYNSSLFYGVVLTPDASAKYADKQSADILNSGIADFVFVKADGSVRSASLPFNAVMSWWNEYAQYYPATRFYVLHRTDLVCGDGGEWSQSSEIADELRCMWDYNNFYGSVFYDASSMRGNKSSFARRISYIMDEGTSDVLKIKKLELDAQNNTVTFSGISDPGHRLLCNHAIANASGGEFSLKYALQAGNNVFSFFSCGKNTTYRIFNNSRLIVSCYPATDINASKDEVITVMAVCMSNCTVKCSLKGAEYPMTVQEGVTVDGVPQGYSVFSCGINFKSDSYTDISLGNITITASLGDHTEAVTGGKITLLKSNSSPALNKVLEFAYDTFHRESEKTEYTGISVAQTDKFKVSPYKDNGLGTSLMCRIFNDDTEQLGPAGAYNTYQADLSTLCEGTLDYVDGMNVSEEGYIRYKLRSGISVYGVNCELINNAYTMPLNNVIAEAVNETASSTDIVFETDWLVPVTVKTLPQTYSNGYQNYSYNVSTYTAEYADITFHHTAALYNHTILNFAADSPFSGCELFSGENNTLILRLYLRQKGQFYGFDIFTDENSRLVVSFKKHSNGALAGKVIMLDPGHGGLSMVGTALQDEKTSESKVTLNIANKARQMLTEQGATVIMTRTMDTPLDLDDRCAILSKYNPDLFISIHCDGSDNPEDAGTHTFYFRPYSQPLAEAINYSMVGTYQTYIYQPTDTNFPKINRGIKYYPFFVTRMNQCPSVLIETGFMTNPIEGSILANDNQQYWLAQGITYGIIRYFSNNNSTVVN